MAWDLQKQPVDARLAEAIGHDAHLRELSYGELRAVMAKAPAPGEVAEFITAASLTVGGEAFGIERLRALPGRFSGIIADTIMAVVKLHGMDSQGNG